MEGWLWRGNYGGALTMEGQLSRGLTMEGQLWRKEIICFSLVIFQRLSAILEKYSDEHSDEHFCWKFETAINWIWNLEILSFPVTYDSHSPSQWYHLANFWSLYHGLNTTLTYAYSNEHRMWTKCQWIGPSAVLISFVLPAVCDTWLSNTLESLSQAMHCQEEFSCRNTEIRFLCRMV